MVLKVSSNLREIQIQQLCDCFCSSRDALDSMDGKACCSMTAFHAPAVEVHDQSNMLILVFASQEDVYKKRKYKSKDTSFDLAKMLRWRWREMGGIDVLTGNKEFSLRPIWVAMGGERESQGNAERGPRRSQGSRQPQQNRSQEGRRRQPQSGASQQ